MKKIAVTSLLILTLLTILSCKNTIQKKDIGLEKNISFNYTPVKPINGKLLGVVELGAAGFNSFIIEVDENLNWELKHKEYGTSLIVEGMTNTELVNQKLRSYIESISTFGLDKKDIYFVVSSGAAKEDITKLISKELKNIGYIVNNVSVTEEGAYALKAILPKKFIASSFLVDIGSGNTKISYFNKEEIPITFETHGAKYYQKGTEDTDVFNDVQKAIAKIPSAKKSNCFIIGGSPTQLARLIQKEESTYTVLNTDPTKFTNIPTNGGKKLQSGLNIYNAIEKDPLVKKIIYFLDGNFTVGFLLEKAQQLKKAPILIK